MPVPGIANSISSSSSHKVGTILVNERQHTTNHLFVLLDHFGNLLGHLVDTKVPFMSGKSEGKVREGGPIKLYFADSNKFVWDLTSHLVS